MKEQLRLNIESAKKTADQEDETFAQNLIDANARINDRRAQALQDRERDDNEAMQTMDEVVLKKSELGKQQVF